MDVMRNEEDFWDHSYYWFTKTALRAIGHWPYQSRKEFIMPRILLQFFYWIQVIPQILAIVKHYDDLDLVLEEATAFATDIAIPVNLCTLLSHSDKIELLLKQVKENWSIFPENNGLQLLHQYTQMGKRLGIIYAVYYYSIWVLYLVEPLHVRWVRIFVPSNESLPLRFPIPVDYVSLDREKYYYCIMVMGAISLFVIVLVMVASDTLIFLYAQHACGLFAALGFSNTIEDIFCWNFFALLGLNMIVISITVSQIVTNIDVIVKLLKFLSYTVGLIAHLFIQCAMSQQITDKSLKLQENLMNVKWYQTTEETKQLIRFMTMRTQRPSQLTAGKIFSLSIATFGSIIRMSATYVTIFLGMH